MGYPSILSLHPHVCHTDKRFFPWTRAGCRGYSSCLFCSLSLSLMFSSFLLFCLHLWLLSRLSHVCLLRIIHGLRRGHRGRSHDRGLVFGCVADGGVERHGVDAVFVGASRPWDRTSSAGTIYTRISPRGSTVLLHMISAWSVVCGAVHLGHVSFW